MKKFFAYMLGIAVVVFLAGLAGATVFINKNTKELPNYGVLEKYEPSVMTRFHAYDGSLMEEFATKRRLYLPIQSIPESVKAAFISAEDRNFYRHYGLDPQGLARALVNNAKNLASGRRPEGASTITQQVAKNFLLTSDTTLQRKVKEAILAMRIEKAYSKDRILELYLNEIYLGRGAYGVAAAALTYFNKSVNELTVGEVAYLASLPKGPSNYDPYKYTQRATERRNWVIGRMAENGYITAQEAVAAEEKPLTVALRGNQAHTFSSGYFTEEVRRRVVNQYGSKALYEGGLSVRTTLNPQMQILARQTLNNGLIKYDQNYGWRGAHQHIDMTGDWGEALADIEPLGDVPEFELAVVLNTAADKVTIGLQPERTLSGSLSTKRETGVIISDDMKWAYKMVDENDRRSTAKSPMGVLQKGDVVFVQRKSDSKGGYLLQQVPKIQGSLLAMEPHTGRVLAMVGGFSYAQSEFNRAAQAYRQPGSAFKPVVYAAALDNGYTPSTVVLDGPVLIEQSNGDAWQPKNYGGNFAGPVALRYGIEYSRNLMTVRLANDLGMQTVAEYAERLGIYDHMLPVLSMALGAGDTTLLRMVKAYSIIANGGHAINSSVIDRIQDRYGKTIYRHDQRPCIGCNAERWDNQPEPKIVDNSDQILDPMTAYQITSMMEGVVQRGTGGRLNHIKRHMAGKTGTTNDSKDAWFIGFTPDIVVGVYFGYDQPKSLGRYGTGSTLAVPTFGEFMASALKDRPDVTFKMPDGMKRYVINRATGMPAELGEDEKNDIVEAFKPGTGPADTMKIIGGAANFREGVIVDPISPQVQDAINNDAGGLY